MSGNPATGDLTARHAPVHGGRRVVAAAAILLAQVLVALDTSIVNVALNRVGVDFSMSLHELSWVSSAYLLCMGLAILPVGQWVNRVGVRLGLVAAFVTFAVALAVAATSVSPVQLIVARGMQGVAAAGLATAGLAALNSLAQSMSSRRSMLLGSWSAAGSAGFACGGVIGGAVTQYWSWRGTFVVLLPAAVLGAVLVWRALPEARQSAARRADVIGLAALAVTAAVALTLATQWQDFTPLERIAGLASGLVCAVLVVRRQRSCVFPPLPRELLGNLRMMAADGKGFAFGLLVSNGLFLTMTLCMQRAWHLGPAAAGLGFLPMAIVAGVLAPVLPLVRMRMSGPVQQVVGAAALAGGLIWLATTMSRGYGFAMVPAMIVSGIGWVLVFVEILDQATADTPPGLRGSASGLFNTATQLGGAFGSALYLGATAALGFPSVFALAAAAVTAVVIVTLCLARIPLRTG